VNEPKTNPLKALEGARVRCQRLRDAKLFSGWVQTLTPTYGQVKVDDKFNAEPGDRFFFQIYGDASCAMLPVSFASVRLGVAHFTIDGAIKTVASGEEMRTLIDGEIKCLLKLGWFESWGQILDVSFSGLGIKTSAPVERGENAHISILSSVGEITGKGEVRYCRKIEGLDGFFRVGLELEEYDRLNMAKWRRFLASVGNSSDENAA